MDIRFVCDGPILYITDIDGCNHVVATVFANPTNKKHKHKRYCCPDTKDDALDADIIYNHVCMDASGVGTVLDCVEFIWNNSNANNQTPKQIKRASG